jgi:ATP-dependent phosphoenolpyruvate carboxykinase
MNKSQISWHLKILQNPFIYPVEETCQVHDEQWIIMNHSFVNIIWKFILQFTEFSKVDLEEIVWF